MAQVEAVIDPRLPVSQGMRTSDLVKSIVGLLSLSNEGWHLGLELRAGSHHSALETEYFFERAFPRLRRVCAADAKVLWRADSGFDSARLLFALADERERWAGLGRSFDFITKWNPHRQDKTAWVARAEAAGAFEEIRPGKRVGLLDLQIERAWKKAKRTLRLVVRVTERTIDKKDQRLRVPEIEIEGWWSSLDGAMVDVIELYKHHGTHGQFHSEIKTDLDLEQVRHQRRGRASGRVRLQLPAPDRATGADQRALADPPPGQAPAHQDGAAGSHVPGGEVRRTRPSPGAGPRARCGGARKGVRGGAGVAERGGFAMTRIRRPNSPTRDHFAAAKGRRMRGSRKMA